MIVTITEFKGDPEKYLELAAQHEIFITRNGECIARLTSPTVDKLAILNNLVGVIPAQDAVDVAKGERLARQ